MAARESEQRSRSKRLEKEAQEARAKVALFSEQLLRLQAELNTIKARRLKAEKVIAIEKATMAAELEWLWAVLTTYKAGEERRAEW